MPDENLRALLWLAETNKGKLTSPAVGSGEERGLISRTAAGNRAYKDCLGRRNVKVDVLVFISEMLIRREFAED